MFSIAWIVTRAGGWRRAALLAACTAVVSGLLLSAVAMVKLGDYAEEELASFVRDGGTRAGVVFAVLLLTLPPLLLLDQAVRLGSAHRDRRLAALRVAGATPSDIRRLGALETGIPAAAGAVLGVGVFALLRTLLGGQPYASDGYFGSNFAVVPTTSSPSLWQGAAVVAFVAVVGTGVGWWSSRGVARAPLGVTRREQGRPPRPWGLGLIVLAALLTPTALSTSHGNDYVAFIVIALLAASMVTLAPWIAFVIAQRSARRTDRPATLLAAQRILAAPGAAGRAAGSIGGIALVGGGVVGFMLQVRATGNSADSSYLAGAILVAGALVVGLLIAAGSMAVHSVESLRDRRREVAFLAATGMPEPELERAARREITAVAVPLAVVGSATGAVVIPVIGEGSVLELAVSLVLGVSVTVIAVWAASWLAVCAVRPWARRMASPVNLRAE